MTFLSLIRIIISRTLAIELMSAIDRWLLGFLIYLPDFGIIIIVAVLHGVGKCWNLRQQLNNLVSVRKVSSEECRRAVLKIPSDQSTLLRGSCLMMFLTSPGETGWIGGFVEVFRICIELATSRLVTGVPYGQCG